MAVQGLWNIGGVNLPDFSVSEKLSNLFGQGQAGGFLGIPNNAMTGGRVLGRAPYGLSPTANQQQYILKNPVVSSPNFSGPLNPNPQPSSQQQTTGGGGWQSLPGYAGWNPTDAAFDYAATGGVGKGGQQQSSGPSPEDLYRQQIEAQQAQARGDISGGYDQYFGQLDQMLNEGLSGQRTAQEGIAQSQYTQGINQLAPQRQEGLDLLGRQREETRQNQARSLRDVSGNIRNAMLAGNVFLGARGAGDSSAANQYSYALNKFGTQQRGDVLRQGSDTMKEIGDREAKIQNIFTQETNRLGSERDQKVMQVASWFADAQRQLQSAKAQGQLAKGQDLASISKTMLNQALNQLNLVNTEATNRRSMLEQWALNNAKTVQEARSNLQQTQQFSPRPFGQSQQVGTPQYDAGGNLITYFPGQNQEERRDIFGNLRQ